RNRGARRPAGAGDRLAAKAPVDPRRRDREHQAPRTRSDLGPAARQPALSGTAEEIFRSADDGGNERSFAVTEFIARLKQRKLVQWALAYVAFSFALLQGVDIVAQRFAWPDQIEKLLILALAIGLLVILVLAWYHGERGAQKVSGTEIVILALLLAIGGGLLWRFERSAPSTSLNFHAAANPDAAASAVS